ncbi:MAG: serine/threonine-protein phosphatase [Treponema sp.]|nr:serine/threonine-protein phosphatase [Treponema sp.]
MYKFKRSLFLFLTMLIVFFISSCKKNDPFYYDLSNSIEYLVTPTYFNIGNIMQHKNEFKKLEKKDFRNLNKLSDKENTNIWLRINFEVPDNLKSKQIGLYIAQFNTADLMFFNNTPLRMYGSFSPNFITAGFQAQFFMLPITMLKQYGENSILIQFSTESKVSLTEPIYIGEQSKIFRSAEITSFFNSKINLFFAAVMFIIFIVFFSFWIQLRSFEESRMFFSFSMLLFYSIHFLVPYFISEISWIKPIWLPYLTIIKFFFGVGAFTTIYFVNSFIVHYINYKETKRIIIIRLILWLIPTASIFFLKELDYIIKAAPFFTGFCLIQFCFSLPKLVKALYESSRKKNALMLLFAFLPVIITVIVDTILRFFLKIYYLPFVTLYGWQITIIIFLLYLLKRFGHMYKHNNELKLQLVDFNTHLEDIVAIRTKEISEANFILSRGMETISHVQKNFLPQKVVSLRGWDIAIAYKALDHDVSGDLYDYYYTDKTLDGLGIFDVSGHGIPAGLMTILAKGIIAQHFINGLENSESTEEILLEINKSYIKEKVDVENYITGLLFRFSDFNKKDMCSIEVANAGHPYPMVYSKAENSVFELKYSGEEEQFGVIGIEDYEVFFPPASCRMGTGDILVCFTDGITESLNFNREDFGKERLMQCIKDNNELSAIELRDKIMQELMDFIGSTEINDDLTLIVLKRTPSKDFIEEL